MQLFDYQQRALEHLLQIHQQRHQVTLDSSDTGVGKTYVAVALAKQFGKTPIIVAPLASHPSWRQVCESAGITPHSIINLEKLRTGKTPWVYKTKYRFDPFRWKLPPNTLIIFDEVHQCGSPKSQNAQILRAAKNSGAHLHLMSATVAESPLRLRAVGYALNLHTWFDFYRWILRNECYKNPWNGFDFRRNEYGLQALRHIHNAIYPRQGIRVRSSALASFPETLIQPEAIELKDAEKLDALYEAAAKLGESSSPLTALLRAREATEAIKIPYIYEQTLELIDEQKSVVIFTNFKNTLHTLAQKFRDAGVAYSEIHGDQTAEERADHIQQFQTNQRPVIICMIQAGSVAISLHDLHNRPRVSLILPPLSARELRQALGRIHRANAQSVAIQKILFAANTVEEKVYRNLKRKLRNLDTLNDGDLIGIETTQQETT